MKELEASRDSLIAEKENLLAIIDENSVALNNMEAQIQKIKSESDQAMGNRISELQSERDKCTSLMSEKGIKLTLIIRSYQPRGPRKDT